MSLLSDDDSELAIRLTSAEFETFSRALAAPPPPSPALEKAMAELQATTVTHTATGRVIDWQPRPRR